jgi:hypothetical protein
MSDSFRACRSRRESTTTSSTPPATSTQEPGRRARMIVPAQELGVGRGGCRGPATRRLGEQDQDRCSSEASRTMSSSTRKASSLDGPASHSSATCLRRACSSSLRGSTGTPIRVVYPTIDSPTRCVTYARCERGSSFSATSPASPNFSPTAKRSFSSTTRSSSGRPWPGLSEKRPKREEPSAFHSNRRLSPASRPQ